LFPLKEIEIPRLRNHVVFIGKDARSLKLSVMAKYLDLPYISIVFDPAIVKNRQMKGETVIYGDAINEPVLRKAHVDTAEVVVVSIGDLITAMAVIAKVRSLNKHAFIIGRTKHIYDIEELYRLGANQVIPEEFETAIEIFERILKKLLIPKAEIEKAIARIRDDNYGIFREKDEVVKFSLSDEIPDIEIVALDVRNYPFFVGNTLIDIQLRNKYGLTLVAIKRNAEIIENPGAKEVFKDNDILYILGKPRQIADAIDVFSRERIS
jgi:CPA2 family monovalent cation:H+ antiporter-2